MKIKVQSICFFILVGFFGALFYHYYFSQYLNYGYPYTTFLFRPGDVFRDYLVHYWQSSNLDPYSNSNTGLPRGNYFPAAYLIIFPFTIIDYALSSKLFFIISIFLSGAMCYKFLKNFNFWSNRYDLYLVITILILFSYPILFCLDRLNIEILPLFFAYLYFDQIRKNNYNAAFIFIVIATLIKPYYLLFILPRVCKDFFRSTAYFLMYFLLLGFISLLFFKRPILENISLIYEALGLSAGVLTLTQPLFFSASLLEPIRYFLGFFISQDSPKLLELINIIFMISCIILAAIVFYISFSNKFSEWEKLYGCAAFIIIGSHVSFDYKLIVIYLPMFAFISAVDHSRLKNTIFCIIFALLLVPKDYYYFSYGIDTSISVILNPIIILSGIFFILIFKIKYLINPLKSAST